MIPDAFHAFFIWCDGGGRHLGFNFNQGGMERVALHITFACVFVARLTRSKYKHNRKGKRKEMEHFPSFASALVFAFAFTLRLFKRVFTCACANFASLVWTSLFTVKIWCLWTCLVPNFWVSLRHRCVITASLESVVSFGWVTWERISQKSILWWHDREARILSHDLGGYSSFWRAIFAILRQSVLLVTSVFFLVLLW